MPVDIIITVGVARPRAQGHAIIRTDMKIESENKKSSVHKNQIIKAKIAIIKTIGTKKAEILSAKDCIGALDV